MILGREVIVLGVRNGPHRLGQGGSQARLAFGRAPAQLLARTACPVQGSCL